VTDGHTEDELRPIICNESHCIPIHDLPFDEAFFDEVSAQLEHEEPTTERSPLRLVD
jgi:hypothetical protein